MNNKTDNKVNIFDAGIILLITVTLFLLSNLLFTFVIPAEWLANPNFYVWVGVIELFAIGLPPILYLVIKKISIKKVFGNKISIEQGVLSFFLAIFCYPILVFVKYCWLMIMQVLRIPTLDAVMPPINTVGIFLIAVISISMIPAISEEFLFRGILQGQFQKKYKARKAIILSAVFFMLMHGDLSSLTYTFAAGLALGILYHQTCSLWTVIIFHATNNFIGVVFNYLISLLGFEYLTEGQTNALPMSYEVVLVLIGMLVISAICFGICALLFWGLKKVSGPKQIDTFDTRPLEKIVYLPYIVAAILLLLLIIVPTVVRLIAA
ncbi:MAG: CPBP family intramembrane metalloprotease [Clostridiales bacterium]|nr:CPBP family intramembrane metalloprotease [Clostridiales bacterium]